MRKWRVIGHHKQIEFLQKSVENHKIAHAYLFYGPKNVGLFTVAKEFAKFLQCPNQKDFCRCKICEDIDQLRHPDTKIFTGTEIISIEELRNLLYDLNLKPLFSPYKICIIKEASRLTLEAQNAFLKTLEEPPLHSILILTTSYPQELLPTIISRCQQIRFGFVAQNEIKNYLLSFQPDVISGKKRISEKEAEDFARLSGGRPGEALNFLEGDKKQFYKDSLSSASKMLKGDLIEKFQLAQKLSEENDLEKILDYWIVYFRDLLLSATNRDTKTDDNYLNILKELLKIQAILRKQSLQKGVNIRLLLENLACQIEYLSK